MNVRMDVDAPDFWRFLPMIQCSVWVKASQDRSADRTPPKNDLCLKMNGLRRSNKAARPQEAYGKRFGSMLSSSTRKTCLPPVKLRAQSRSERGLPAWFETFRRGNLFGVDDDYFVAAEAVRYILEAVCVNVLCREQPIVENMPLACRMTSDKSLQLRKSS
jgi:hypothetical protein